MPIYPSNISREQYELIEEELSSHRKKTRPRTVDTYDVFCGVLYVLRTGCQWRQLPKDFPKWRTCHYYFQQWSEKKDGAESVLERCLKKW